ncbi:MAG: sulfatase-like hydrolase/transferase [Lentisphaerae bacterium]|nr:sulfatase-like hydrolase/transferase [Lentisphaerota bacterium]
MPIQPNILYLFSDQQTAGTLGCDGNRDLRTPALDSLAARGTRFENAYCTFPLCTPSRASMFTGLMPHQLGIERNGQGIPEGLRAAEIAPLLARHGYDCAYGGKWHVPEEAMSAGHGFDSICGFSDWELPGRCVDFIRRPREKPFFLVASFDNPHNICEWSRQQALPWGPVPDCPTGQCPALPPNFAVTAFEPEAVRRENQALLLYRAGTFTPDDWRQYRHAYYRLVEKVDAAIATILGALRESGQEDRTLVIFSSDHGDGAGAHQWNQKCALYEECVRVPLLVAPPGPAPVPGAIAPHLVSEGLDLYPTLCDYAGIQPPEGREGLSLRPLIEGRRGIPWRSAVTVETLFDGGRGTRGLMVRTARHKYTLYSWGKYREQLFDLATDPGEQINLAADPVHRDVLQHHRDLLAQWIERTDYRQGTHYAHPRVRPRVPGQEYPRQT